MSDVQGGDLGPVNFDGIDRGYRSMPSPSYFGRSDQEKASVQNTRHSFSRHGTSPTSAAAAAGDCTVS